MINEMNWDVWQLKDGELVGLAESLGEFLGWPDDELFLWDSLEKSGYEKAVSFGDSFTGCISIASLDPELRPDGKPAWLFEVELPGDITFFIAAWTFPQHLAVQKLLEPLYTQISLAGSQDQAEAS